MAASIAAGLRGAPSDLRAAQGWIARASGRAAQGHHQRVANDVRKSSRTDGRLGVEREARQERVVGDVDRVDVHTPGRRDVRERHPRDGLLSGLNAASPASAPQSSGSCRQSLPRGCESCAA